MNRGLAVSIPGAELNYGVFKCKLGGFEVVVKTASQKIKDLDENIREIGEGPKFALSAVTRTAS